MSRPCIPLEEEGWKEPWMGRQISGVDIRLCLIIFEFGIKPFLSQESHWAKRARKEIKILGLAEARVVSRSYFLRLQKNWVLEENRVAIIRSEEFWWHPAPNNLSLSALLSTHLSCFLFSFYIPLISSLLFLCYFLPFIILSAFRPSFFSFGPSFLVLIFSFVL